MLLQRLNELDDRNAVDRPPSMYQHLPIRWVVELDAEGRLGGFVPTSDPTDKRGRRGLKRLAPHIKRAVAVVPKLLADTGVYVFGVPGDKDRPDRVLEQVAAFRELVRTCAVAIDEPSVEAVLRFLDGPDAEALSLPADFAPGDVVTFRVDGVFPIDLPAVRQFWATHTGALRAVEVASHGPGVRAESLTSDQLPCIACGQMRPAAERHPIPIKGIPGGQTSGTNLISANDNAFESYGLQNSLIAPTCAPCAEAYANALNRLLADPGSRVRSDTGAYVFWTAAEAEPFSPVTYFDDPQPDAVKTLIEAPFTARPGALVLDHGAFYALGLGAAGARVIVRSWLDTTVGEAKRRVARWFALQDLVAPNGGPGSPVPLRRLAEATVRLNARGRPLSQSEKPSPRTVDALIALALAGTPLPDGVLIDAVRRCRADQGVTRERAMLIKMGLGSQAGLREGRSEPMPHLDETNADPAYLCGRLLAKFDALQRRALGTRNATVIDRFYGSASTAPASVFGMLHRNAQHHFATLRKDPKRQAAGRAIEADIQAISVGIRSFPHILTLPQQGLFALGYYHQKADDQGARDRWRANAGSPDQAGDRDAGQDEIEVDS